MCLGHNGAWARLPTLARECDRWGVSDRSAAALASAVLVDCGIIDAHDSSDVIDPSKIRRERQKKEKHYKLVLTKHWKVYISMVEKTELVVRSLKKTDII